MSLYSEVKSPLDDINTYIKLIDIYATGKTKRGSYIDNPVEFYKAVLSYEPQADINDPQYILEFKKYVKNKNINALFKFLSAYNPEEYDVAIEKTIEKINNRTDISKWDKEDKIDAVKAKYFYPLSDFGTILKKFNNYEEFLNYFKKMGFDNVEKDNNSIYSRKMTKEDILKKYGYSKEAYYVVCKYILLKNKLAFAFNGGAGIMGFHVNPQNINLADTSHRETSDVKFYINAGVDTYKFAYYFQKECIKEGVNYYYKVVNPEYNEQKRADKMCIFTSYENSNKIFDIIKKVKQEHPEISYNTPPFLTGKIDGWIGIGQDSVFENGSYNHNMSFMAYKALSEEFKDMDRKTICTLKKEELLKRIRNIRSRMISDVSKYDIDVDKICLKKDARDILGDGSSAAKMRI